MSISVAIRCFQNAFITNAESGTTAWFALGVNGVFATTVADAALMLSVIAADPALARVGDAADGPTLRIAVSTKPPLQGLSVDREHVKALFASAAALLHAGHEVERSEPSYPNAAAIAGLSRWFAGTAADVRANDAVVTQHLGVH